MKKKIVMKSILWLFIFSYAINLHAQKAILTNFRIENANRDRVYFDSSGDISGMTKTGFIISDKLIKTVSIEEKYFVVSEPFTFWENNTIRLGEITDTSDRQTSIHNFTLSFIQNNIKEPSATIYRYVSPTGAGSHDGTSEANAWSPSEIMAVAGMTIGVKIGDYSEKQIILDGDNGLVDRPIKIIGYKSIIGDINTNYYNYSDSFDSSEMPLFIGNNKDIDKALYIRESDYIIVRNIQIKDYGVYPYSNYYGILGLRSNNVVLENINAENSNRNIFFIGNNIRISSCNSLNAWEFNYQIKGNHSLVIDNKSYCNNLVGIPGEIYPSEATDYYYVCVGNNNIYKNNYAKRDGEVIHFGHGMSLYDGYPSDKITTKYNLIENFTSVNILSALELRHDHVSYNVIKKFKSIGEGAGSDKAGGFHFRDGANFNIIEESTIDFSASSNTEACLYFQEYGESGVGLGNDNIVRNCVFSNAYIGVLIEDYTSGAPTGSNNMILNCTFNNIEYFVRENNVGIGLNNTNITNCIFNNIKYETKGDYKSSFNFDYNNFYNSWTSTLGANSMSVDPKFENPSGGNFRLMSDSPLINKGKNLNEVQSDFDGNSRPQGGATDIGAFEFQENTTASVNASAGSDQAICLGESVTLTSSGGSIYSWNTGATTQSITVNPNETTIYTVTVREGSVSDTDSVQVIVNSVSARAGVDKTMYEGESVTLTASGGDSYVWNTGETTKSVTVSPKATTTYTVTAKQGDCEDTDAVQVTVNQNNDPAVTASAGLDQTICQGESVTLTASGGSTYSWNTGATTKSVTVNPGVTTTYTVTVSEGSVSNSDSVQVTVNNVTANAGSDKTMYEGESVTLTASGGASYLWSTGATSKSITISPQETQNYTLTAYENGCEDIDTIQVTVNKKDTTPPPAKANAGKDQTICLGDYIKLTASGGTTYVWSTGETTKSINVNPTRTTSYTLTATRGGVTNSDAMVVTVENCSAIGEGDPQDEFTVYPNPTKGDVNISVKNVIGDVSIFVSDAKGSIIYSQNAIKGTGDFHKKLDMSGFTKGIYYVGLSGTDINEVQKLMVVNR